MSMTMLAIAATLSAAQPDGGPAVNGGRGSPPRLKATSFMIDDDYPAEALRLKQEGIVGISLHISERGKVTNCSIVDSSGFHSLDAASCAVWSKMTFEPARGVDGRKTEGDYVRKVRWTLPRK